MVVVADDDAYLEGRVTAVADDRFSMAIFNKFNYTDVRALQVDFSDILVMEFHGLDLKLETELVRKRDQLHHVPTKLYQNDGQLEGVFQNALAENRLISVDRLLRAVGPNPSFQPAASVKCWSGIRP